MVRRNIMTVRLPWEVYQLVLSLFRIVPSGGKLSLMGFWWLRLLVSTTHLLPKDHLRFFIYTKRI